MTAFFQRHRDIGTAEIQKFQRIDGFFRIFFCNVKSKISEILIEFLKAVIIHLRRFRMTDWRTDKA